MVFKRGVELCDEVGESPEGERSSRDGTLAEGRSPSKGRSLGHVREGKGDLLIVIVIDSFVDKEVKLHGVQPVLGLFIGSVERFGGADA